MVETNKYKKFYLALFILAIIFLIIGFILTLLLRNLTIISKTGSMITIIGVIMTFYEFDVNKAEDFIDGNTIINGGVFDENSSFNSSREYFKLFYKSVRVGVIITIIGIIINTFGECLLSFII